MTPSDSPEEALWRGATSNADPGWASRLLRDAIVVVGSALVLTLACGGGSFELGGRRWLSLHSLDRPMLIGVVLAGIELALRIRSGHIGPRDLLGALRTVRSEWPLLLVLGAGVGLRLIQYVAPRIELFPYAPAQEGFGRFLLTNLFVVGGTLALSALGRHWGDRNTGLLAAIVFSLSPWTIYFGRFHTQQAAAVSTGVLAALCWLRWLDRSGPALPAVAFGTVAILLDSLNFHLVGLFLAMSWSVSRRRYREVLLVVGVLLGFSIAGRIAFVPTVDLWMPPVPSVTAVALGPATLFILYDRFLTLALPAGAALLFLVGIARIGGRHDAVVPVWVMFAVIWTVWADNRHLVHSAIYFPLVAAGSVAAARGASWILAVSDRTLLWRNLGWIAVAGLLFSVVARDDPILQRAYRWNTATAVWDRDSVPLSWVDGLRAHGAWYLMTNARTVAEFPDRQFLEAMVASYGIATAADRVVFPILRHPTEYHRPTGAARGELLPLRWEAEELPTQVGRVVFDGMAANEYGVRADRAGVVVHGPYLAYPPGGYAVDFRVRITKPPKQNDVGRLDVARDGGRDLLARRDLTIGDFPRDSGYRDFSLSVTVDRPDPIEFRVVSAGSVSLWVDRILVRTLGAPPLPR